jgi:Protein of unknown function (DUF3465)
MMAEQSSGGSLKKKIIGLVIAVVLAALGYGKMGGKDAPVDPGTSSGSQNTSTKDSVPNLDDFSAKPKTTPSNSKRNDTVAKPAEPVVAKSSDRQAQIAAAGRIEKLFHDKKSKVWVEVEGTNVKNLPDDNKGSRHQLFLLKLITGHTLKISHNIDLAPYIPIREGDRVSMRGRYEWNDRGGVVHWTHHDPRGRMIGGWIDHKGKRYK